MSFLFLSFLFFSFFFCCVLFLFLFLFFFGIIQSQTAFVNCLYVARFTIVHSKTQIKFPLLLLLLLFYFFFINAYPKMAFGDRLSFFSSREPLGPLGKQSNPYNSLVSLTHLKLSLTLFLFIEQLSCFMLCGR